MANPGNVAGGYKATLSNPNTSEEAKEHAKEVLETEFAGGDTSSSSDAGKNPNNVAGGLKATLSNPNTSEEAKESAKERLDKM
ncbi:MAG: hypothetical protein M1826_001626 [Phylliscum demangeonii]|nr:MAG: hypothetical protein M1826_001626 [Phylliscum demangeonii]